MEKPLDFYVYLHRKATTGEVFYVGKGRDDRAWRGRRNSLWVKTAKKHGRVVEIVESGLQEWAAFEIECGLIAQYGRKDTGDGTLVNFSDGGEGVANPSESTRRLKSKKMKLFCADPAFRKATSERMRMRNMDSEFQKIAQLGRKKRFSDASFMEAHISRTKAMHTDHEFKKSCSEWMKRMRSDPDLIKATVAALREVNSKETLCVETGRAFSSGSDAATWLIQSGVTHSSHKTVRSKIYDCCAGRNKSAYGYVWQSVEKGIER